MGRAGSGCFPAPSNCVTFSQYTNSCYQQSQPAPCIPSSAEHQTCPRTAVLQGASLDWFSAKAPVAPYAPQSLDWCSAKGPVAPHSPPPAGCRPCLRTALLREAPPSQCPWQSAPPATRPTRGGAAARAAPRARPSPSRPGLPAASRARWRVCSRVPPARASTPGPCTQGRCTLHGCTPRPLPLQAPRSPSSGPDLLSSYAQALGVRALRRPSLAVPSDTSIAVSV